MRQQKPSSVDSTEAYDEFARRREKPVSDNALAGVTRSYDLASCYNRPHGGDFQLETMRLMAHIAKLFGFGSGRSSRRIPVEIQELAYLRKRVFKDRCPVCERHLDVRHSLAHVGACSLPCPDETRGFINEVKERNWAEVTGGFAIGDDKMFCDVVACPNGFGLLVWVELYLLHFIKQKVSHEERIDLGEVERIGGHTALTWLPFPD